MTALSAEIDISLVGKDVKANKPMANGMKLMNAKMLAM